LEIRFRTGKLQKRYEKFSEAEKSYGREVARKYIQRVNIIKQARDINELCALPCLRCHPLKGDRQGQWAVKLTGFYRLIFTLEDEKPIKDPSMAGPPTGRVTDWLEIARIEEVSKHYDD